ncbi:MAG: hypothetical protein II385_00275, partial [Bacteroidaceae bacterium]|nr:hypothetical protein [Bacteroidaceae bacterium]
GAMAARVAQAVRDSLGIASPSKVMMAFGAYTAQGLAEGIDASMAMVTRASRRMASAVVSPMSDAAASAGRTVNNSATSSLYIDKYYQRSDADVDSLAAAIADKNRLGRYGNGLRT